MFFAATSERTYVEGHSTVTSWNNGEKSADRVPWMGAEMKIMRVILVPVVGILIKSLCADMFLRAGDSGPQSIRGSRSAIY